MSLLYFNYLKCTAMASDNVHGSGCSRAKGDYQLDVKHFPFYMFPIVFID